jgi:hypothetical protein
MVDIESITIIEYLSIGTLNTNNRFAIPSNTSDNEKNIFIALTAIISSVAALSIYEYHFQIPGTKKCQIPKPIEIKLPKVVSMITVIFMYKLFYNFLFSLRKFVLGTYETNNSQYV